MNHRKLLLSLYVPSFLLALGEGLTVATFPLYAQSFDVSYTLVSLAVAALGMGTLVADVPVGMVLDRLGRRPMMLAGAVAFALSALALALAQTFPELIVYRLIAGVGTAMWHISRMAFVTDVVPVADRGRALSTFGGLMRIGFFGGPAVGGIIAATFGLAAPFLVTAALGAVALLISVLFATESRSERWVQKTQMRWGVVGGVVKRHYRELSTAGAAQVFVQMIRAGRQIIVPLFGSSIGLDVASVGVIISISAAIDMSLFVPAGFIMDRFGRKYASVPSFGLLALGMAMVPFATGYWSLLAATAVMGLGNGLGAGTMMTLGADFAPREAAGEFLGVWRFIGDVGRTGGPVVVGGIADGGGLGMAAFVLSGVGLLAAGTLAFFVQETLKPQEDTVRPEVSSGVR